MLIPKTMRTLAKDHRGYPIPFIVMRDKSGQPQFTINDFFKVRDCHAKRLCAICGKRLNEGFWFIGGSRCFLHEHGAFVDPPTHYECAEFAMRVCPFLAARKYTKRIDAKKLKRENIPDTYDLVLVEGMPPALPERFGLGHSSNYALLRRGPGDDLHIIDHWNYIEWWKNGERINAPDTPVSPPLPGEE